MRAVKSSQASQLPVTQAIPEAEGQLSSVRVPRHVPREESFVTAVSHVRGV